MPWTRQAYRSAERTLMRVKTAMTPQERVIGCVPNALKMRRLDHVEEETSAIVAVLSRLANDKVMATPTIHKKTETPYR
jgi:hypothetical protein